MLLKKEKLLNLRVLPPQYFWLHLFRGNISDLKYLNSSEYWNKARCKIYCITGITLEFIKNSIH